MTGTALRACWVAGVRPGFYRPPGTDAIVMPVSRPARAPLCRGP